MTHLTVWQYSGSFEEKTGIVAKVSEPRTELFFSGLCYPAVAHPRLP